MSLSENNQTTILLVGALTSVAFAQYLSDNRYQNYYSRSIGAGRLELVNSAGYKQYIGPGNPKTESKNTPRKFITMLMEDDMISLTRVQLFAWTWIALFIYVISFIGILGAAFADQAKNVVTLPDIDQNLLALSGISQAGFVAGKAAMKTPDVARANAPAREDLLVKKST
jgi:hypothetical protein